MEGHNTDPGVRRVALAYVAKGYHVTRVDERGVWLSKRNSPNPVGCLVLGWAYMIVMAHVRDDRVLVSANTDGLVVVKRMRRL